MEKNSLQMTPAQEMPLWDHLSELRKCLLRSVIGLTFTTILSFVYWREIWHVLTVPLREHAKSVVLINTSPFEAIFTSFKVSLFAGFILGSPWILWNLWRFVAPGLFKHEKSAVLPIFLFSIFLFLAGASFSFYVILPYGLEFLSNYTMGEVAPNWRQGEYAGFLLQAMLAFGFTFELPLLAYVLAKLGLITGKTLKTIFPYAIVVIFIVAAILTPPDPITQILLAIPLCILYGISILVASVVNPIPKDTTV